MKYLLLLKILCITISLSAQEIMLLETNASGLDRNIFIVNNLNTSSFSASSMTMRSDVGTDLAEGKFTTWGKSYTALPGYAGYSGLSGLNSGLLLRAPDALGDIKLITGGNDLTTFTRLTIEASGDVGIGTSDPKTKLEVNGDVYISDVASSLILRSANGSCFELVVSNAGALSTSPISCPN